MQFIDYVLLILALGNLYKMIVQGKRYYYLSKHGTWDDQEEQSDIVLDNTFRVIVFLFLGLYYF